LGVAGATATELPQAIPIKKVDRALLAGADQKTRNRRTALIRQNHRGTRAQIQIARCQIGLIERREIVDQGERVAALDELQETVSDISVPIEPAGAGHDEMAGGFIHRDRAPGLPDPSPVAAGSGDKDTTPNGYRGGIWQSGGSVAVDEPNNLYVMTSNGLPD